jgi:hypothetical protein
MQYPDIPWPPRVNDYVFVAATGELGLVTTVAGRDDTLRFLVRIYPPAEKASPRARHLTATSTLQLVYRLNELEPDARPPSTD